MNIYELYGRLQERYESECAMHRQTVQVLADLKSGKLRLDQVDVQPESFSYQTFANRPAPVGPAPVVEAPEEIKT